MKFNEFKMNLFLLLNKMIHLFSLLQVAIVINTMYQLQKSPQYKTVFQYLLLPFILYSAIGHLLLSQKVAQSIGWKSSPFQLELGYFTLALFLVGYYSLITNKSETTLRTLGNVWLLFIFMASVNHIREIIFQKNYSFNNVYPIGVTAVTSYFLLRY